jgi:hypothetical protein
VNHLIRLMRALVAGRLRGHGTTVWQIALPGEQRPAT